MVISENSSDKKPEKKEKPSTKVIIRRLPPSIDQETFLNQVSPVPDYNYIYTVKGDFSLGDNAFSRVYINFVYPDDVYTFKERFDNYVFIDNRTGHEYPAVVEFAPFQKIPKKRGKRVDPKSGTIETDPVYLDFVESLNKPEEQEEKPEYTLQLNSEDKGDKNDVTTPLLEFIKNKRAQKLKIREMRREERERKRREFENRKKDYPRGYDVRKYDEKVPGKGFKSSHGSKVGVTKSEEKVGEAGGDNNNKTKLDKSDNNNTTSTSKLDNSSNTKSKQYDNKPSATAGYGNKNRDRKYEDRDRDRPEQRGVKKDIKPRFPKKDYDHDYSTTKGGYNASKKSFDDAKNKNKEENTTTTTTTKPGYNQKKVKKYSERREERKIEAQKAEQRKLEQTNKEKDSSKEGNKEKDSSKEGNKEKASFKEGTNEKDTSKDGIKEEDSITVATGKDSSSEGQSKAVNKETVASESKEAEKNKDLSNAITTTEVVVKEETTTEISNSEDNKQNEDGSTERTPSESNSADNVSEYVKAVTSLENTDAAKSSSAEESSKDSGSGSRESRQKGGSGSGSKESEAARRIRNKDRPTIAIYRPGMLSKRKQNDDDPKG